MVFFLLVFMALIALQLLMNVPYTAIHFASYESCKKYFSEVHHGAEDKETLGVQLGAGGIAGGLAAAATTPLDVVKTRLQLEGVTSATRYGTVAVVCKSFTLFSLVAFCMPRILTYHPCTMQRPILRQIWQEEGASALIRGWQPRVLFHIPSAAICWGIYESFKSWLAIDAQS